MTFATYFATLRVVVNLSAVGHHLPHLTLRHIVMHHRGPNTVPCGTPDVTWVGWECLPSHTTV